MAAGDAALPQAAFPRCRPFSTGAWALTDCALSHDHPLHARGSNCLAGPRQRGPARALGGDVVFSGGTSSQRTVVSRALEVSRFDWDLVPAQIRIHIAAGQSSHAARGEIWLDADLLDAGTFGWGIVQHEFAHQIDFFLLDDADRPS